MKILLNDNWKIINAGKYLSASVPGDITIDMFNAGLISNPYIAENLKMLNGLEEKTRLY